MEQGRRVPEKRDSVNATGRPPRRRFRGERGSVLVEAAFITPVLFFLMFSVLEFGMAFKDYLALANTSRDGARAASIVGNDTSADFEILQSIVNVERDRPERHLEDRGVQGDVADHDSAHCLYNGDLRHRRDLQRLLGERPDPEPDGVRLPGRSHPGQVLVPDGDDGDIARADRSQGGDLGFRRPTGLRRCLGEDQAHLAHRSFRQQPDHDRLHGHAHGTAGGLVRMPWRLRRGDRGAASSR